MRFHVLTVGFLWILMMLWCPPTLHGDASQKTTFCERMLTRWQLIDCFWQNSWPVTKKKTPNMTFWKFVWNYTDHAGTVTIKMVGRLMRQKKWSCNWQVNVHSINARFDCALILSGVNFAGWDIQLQYYWRIYFLQSCHAVQHMCNLGHCWEGDFLTSC